MFSKLEGTKVQLTSGHTDELGVGLLSKPDTVRAPFTKILDPAQRVGHARFDFRNQNWPFRVQFFDEHDFEWKLRS